MPFKEYMHIERFGTDEVQGIELGDCYVFPKLDGTNASVWVEDGKIRCGSRKRELSIDNDNAGFCAYVEANHGIFFDFFLTWPMFRLYGEWLVPHTFKNYREGSWRKFYIFDVYSTTSERYMHYSEYETILKVNGLDYIPPLCTIKNATYDNLLVELENNKFLVTDGKGAGEGIVIKNYNFENRFGRTVWAKMITTAFKDKHVVEMGVPQKKFADLPEQVICDKYVTPHFVNKVYAKIANENGGWNSKYIPRLLQTVYYDLITEESWNFVKELKMPTVNFKTLNHLTINSVKQIRPELF